MKRLRSTWPVFASGILYAAAFPPLNLGLLVFAALVPWLLSLRTATGKGAFWSGALFGALFWLVQMAWVGQFVGRWTENIGLGMLVWVLCPVLGCWYFAVAGWLIQRCFSSGLPWLVPLVWMGVEFLRSYVPLLAFPWALLATPLWFTPQLIQLASIGTVFLVSAYVALVNVIVVMMMTGEPGRTIYRYCLIVLIVTLASWMRYTQPPAGEPLTVTVGQPGVDMAFTPTDERARRLDAACRDLAAAAVLQGSRLLVLPEGLTESVAAGVPPNPLGPNPPLPVIFGGQRLDRAAYQSAFAYDGKWSFADKTRLVIFGEYVPFREYLPFLESFRLPGGDLTPGDKVRALDVAGVSVGPILCFEALFPDVALQQQWNGARLLAVMSIDDWYMGTNAPEQLRAAAIWRAVECGLPLVRSAGLGFTFATDARGRVIAEAPLGQLVALRVELRVPVEGDGFKGRGWVPWAGVLACLAALAWPLLARRREAGA